MLQGASEATRPGFLMLASWRNSLSSLATLQPSQLPTTAALWTFHHPTTVAVLRLLDECAYFHSVAVYMAVPPALQQGACPPPAAGGCAAGCAREVAGRGVAAGPTPDGAPAPAAVHICRVPGAYRSGGAATRPSGTPAGPCRGGVNAAAVPFMQRLGAGVGSASASGAVRDNVSPMHASSGTDAPSKAEHDCNRDGWPTCYMVNWQQGLCQDILHHARAHATPQLLAGGCRRGRGAGRSMARQQGASCSYSTRAHTPKESEHGIPMHKGHWLPASGEDPSALPAGMHCGVARHDLWLPTRPA